MVLHLLGGGTHGNPGLSLNIILLQLGVSLNDSIYNPCFSSLITTKPHWLPQTSSDSPALNQRHSNQFQMTLFFRRFLEKEVKNNIPKKGKFGKSRVHLYQQHCKKK